MLVLARKQGQSIIIGRNIRIVVAEVTGETVRLGIEAPPDMEIFREELYRDLQIENKKAITSTEEVIRFLKNNSKEENKST
ncbi:MAG TPA: carbon storage regulator [Pelotomaculum sp.]|nr:carbon storage regulator [Pelotomaculum sp.]